MEKWEPLRHTICEHAFEASLAALGIDQEAFDDAFVDLQCVLDGVPVERLYEEFPEIDALPDGYRIVLTDEHLGVPPLRVLIRYPHPDDDAVHLVAVGLRPSSQLDLDDD